MSVLNEPPIGSVVKAEDGERWKRLDDGWWLYMSRVGFSAVPVNWEFLTGTYGPIFVVSTPEDCQHEDLIPDADEPGALVCAVCDWSPTEALLIAVRRNDLALLMAAFDNPNLTALGSRPFDRIRAALAEPVPLDVARGELR